MIHADNGDVQLKGMRIDIMVDFTTICMSMVREFPAHMVTACIFTALEHCKDDSMSKTDLTRLAALLHQAQNEDEKNKEGE